MTSRNLSDKLEKEVVAGAVSQEPADIAAALPVNPVFDSGAAPTHIVRPKSVEQIQGLAQLANREHLNMTVSSSTGPHGKDGAVSRESAIRMDLSGMRQILWINRRNRVCMIEPGVTFPMLQEALAARGMTAPMPLAPRGTKSVLASILDREPITWPNRQWDLSDPIASMEFIFGNGTLFRTGAAGGPGTIEQQRAAGGAQKCPLGPSQTDFHRVIQGAQGTMGIASWITLRAELRPSMQKPLCLGGDRLEPLIAFTYEVQRPWLGEHAFIMNRAAAALLMGDSPETCEAIRQSLPAYVCLQNLAGFERFPKERIDYQLKDIGQIARCHELKMEETIGSLTAVDFLDRATKPCGPVDWRHTRKGHCLTLFFLTTLDRTAGYIRVMEDAAREVNVDSGEVGVYIQPAVQNHCCHVEFMLPFDPKNPSDVDRVRRFEQTAVQRLLDANAYFSRPYGPNQAGVFDRNPLNTEVLKKVKTIFDPNRVLNRGKWSL